MEQWIPKDFIQMKNVHDLDHPKSNYSFPTFVLLPIVIDTTNDPTTIQFVRTNADKNF